MRASIATYKLLSAVFSVICLFAFSCTSFRPIESSADGSYRNQIVAGKTYIFYDQKGTSTKIEVAMVDSARVNGSAFKTEDDGTVSSLQTQLPLAEIQKAKVRTFSPGKTIAFVVGPIGITVLAIIAYNDFN